MTIRWNRETILVIIMSIMILIGGFYYGNIYLVDPLEEEADIITQTVNAQKDLIANYPPSEELYNEYEVKDAETEAYLPKDVEINKGIVRFEQLAGQSNVEIQSFTRSGDRQSIEELSNDYLRNTYEVQMISDSPVNFRRLINALENEERVWNVTGFSYNQSGEESYTGSFTLDIYYLNNEN